MFTKSKKSARALRAFTLIEMMITLTIFAVVSLMATYTMITAVKSAKKIQANAYLYSEAQAIMDQLARSIEVNTVDYEAYYSRVAKGDTGWETPDYGFYAQSFYNPGSGGDGSEGPYDEIYAEGYYGANELDGVPVSDELDFDAGAHPFTGIEDFAMFGDYYENPSSMNAFCEGTVAECANPARGIWDELILINGGGDSRLIYRLTASSDEGEYQLAKMSMLGTDTDNDGIVDTWECNAKYDCSGTFEGNAVPLLADFKPITPSAINVREFYVQISPLEDPYRAFAEEDSQIQPQITITLTVGLSQNYAFGLLGDLPTITLQRTISTGVYSKVESYE
ncbi:MAG: prepilin-type N-terminal cleavage/methylation domain-containing protein [Candidatus Gracilibacteria bacterium]